MGGKRYRQDERIVAVKHLKKSDRILAAYIDRIGVCSLGPSRHPFDVLARSIIGQQLSATAARTITSRLESAVGCTRPFLPELLLDANRREMAGAGVSRAKISCLKSLAEMVVCDPRYFQRLKKINDEDVIAELSSIRGIGRWTSEMFLIFGLGRLDVLSTTDAGLRRGMQIMLGLDERIADDEYVAYAERWRPYRSIASWYLWAIIDNKMG